MTAEPGINAFSRAIGDLEATVRNMTATWTQQESNASAGRRVLHEKMDSIKKDVAELKGRVDNVASALAEIEPAVKEFKIQRERAIGARNFGRWIWGGMLTAAGGAGWAINEWLHLPRSH